MMGRLFVVMIVLAAGTGLASSQQSASYKVEEHVLNSGGSPLAGTGAVLSSASFRVKLSSLGEGLVGPALSSASFRVDSGFTQGILPPGEVEGLIFTGANTLEWNPHLAAGTYNLYRGLQSNLAGLGFGQCVQQQLAGTNATDGELVPAGDALLYLVTVANKIGEEGGKGFQSDGSARQGNMCP